MFVFRKFPLVGEIDGTFWRSLIDCDLCLGVWIYTVLAYMWGLSLGENYIIGLSELVVGSVTSFLVYVFVEGWNSLFRIVEI